MSSASPSLPAGLRLYAIGDIHGNLGLLEKLLTLIKEDSRGAQVTVRKIFLGDYIDRGLRSREVLDFLIGLREQELEPSMFLMGNHEQILRDIVLYGKIDMLDSWLAFGGRETLMSYGIKPPGPHTSKADIVKSIVEKTPRNHIEFIDEMAVSATFGDYFFCHAGVRPGVALDIQKEEDLVWIRNEFLNHDKPFGKVVVHGHSIRPEAEFRSNRIGIDTGAYATGKLTALGLEGNKKWLLQTA